MHASSGPCARARARERACARTQFVPWTSLKQIYYPFMIYGYLECLSQLVLAYTKGIESYLTSLSKTQIFDLVDNLPCLPQFVPGKSLKQILQMAKHGKGLALHIIRNIASSLLKTLKFMNSNEVPHISHIQAHTRLHIRPYI